MRNNAVAAADALSQIFGSNLRRFNVRLWNGETLGAQNGATFTLLVNDPGALRAAFRPPVDLNAGRAFAAGLLDIEGDAEAAIDALMHSAAGSRMRMIRAALALRALPKAAFPKLREAALRGKRHSLARDRAAIGFHYDQPVDFYRTFLGESLVYSCAYFDRGVQTLEQAQLAKIDYSLRKLRLKAGERLLDIGCGWGALVVRAAQQFGAKVLGVTLSSTQVAEARRRIAQAGVEAQASVELCDYRELPETSFDKIVSIGMFEHVGRKKMREYFEGAHRLLRKGGLFLNHAIATQEPGDGKATGFMNAFIFPDGELVRVSEALHHAENAGFEVRDVENLREHYHRTVREWIRRLEDASTDAIEAAGEQSYRAWRLYMAGSAQGFGSGRLGLFQSLLAKPRDNAAAEVPVTRRDLYAAAGP